MFGSIVLEVLIGLALVFLLLSLVCSTLQEAIASARNWRGTMLREAITRLFECRTEEGRGNVPPPNPTGVPGSAPTDWAQSIYDHPLIDSLHNDEGRYPSYIPNPVFADALLDRMVRGANTSGAPLSPTDRLLAVLRGLNSGETASGALNPKTASTLSLLMDRARQRVGSGGADVAIRTLDAFREEICGWYENTMSRATGWYRRHSQFAQFCLAAIVVAATNADTVMISEQLARDPKVREATANAAAKFIEEHPELRAQEKGEATAAPTGASGGAEKQDSKTPPKAPPKDAAQKPGESGSAAGANAEVKALQASVQQLQDTTREAQVEVGWPDPALKRLKKEQGESVTGSAWWLYLLRKFLGLAITICAVALGAPFWFQMLEKLVKLRGSGTKPEASTGVPGTDTSADGPKGPTPGGATTTVAAASSSGTTAVLSTSSTAASAGAALEARLVEALDDRYWSNVEQRWKDRPAKVLPPSGEPKAEEGIALFLARMSALAYEPKWTIGARLATFGIGPDDWKFFDHGGTQVFALQLGDDLVVAYRGTEPARIEDLLSDANFALKKIPSAGGGALYAGEVHVGFADAVEQVFDDLEAWLANRKAKGRVFLTGHSLGAALATLHFDRRTSAKEAAVERHELITFGSPRVGDAPFCADFEKRVGAKTNAPRTRVLRFVNNRDLVTRVAPRSMKFDHVGAERYIDSEGGVSTGAEAAKKWIDFTLLVLDGLAEFKAAAKKPIGDHAIALYVRRLENWTGWRS